MDPAERLRSVTQHRDALLAEVKTLQRDKAHLRRDVEALRQDLAATSSARDAAVLETAALRRRMSTAAPSAPPPIAPPPPRARSRATPPARAPPAAPAAGFGLPAAPAAGFGLAAPRAPRAGAFGIMPPAPLRTASAPAAPRRAPARQILPPRKKPRAPANMKGLIDGLYLTSVWNDELAADYTRALLDDVWCGTVPPVAALSGALELRAWRLAGPKAQVKEWEADNQKVHPFDSGEDTRIIAAHAGRKQARRRLGHALDDDAEDAWASAAQGSIVGSMGLPERSMREARVTLAKWRHASTNRPCPILPDDVFLSHIGPCLDGNALACLEASCRYFWVPRKHGLGPSKAVAAKQLGPCETFYTASPCERLQKRLDVGARLQVLRARNRFQSALREWKEVIREARLAETLAAQRAYESALALLEDIRMARDAIAAAKAAQDHFAPGEILEKIVDFEQTREKKRLKPFNNPRQCMLAPKGAKFTKDAAAGTGPKRVFDIFRKPEKRRRTDSDDEVEILVEVAPAELKRA